MARESRERSIVIYADERGYEPFIDWIESLKDPRNSRRILKRISRIEGGNFGDHKNVGDGVFELRLFFGSGYRVYFAENGDTVVVLLCGGDKSSQDKDIKKAKIYWVDYQESK